MTFYDTKNMLNNYFAPMFLLVGNTFIGLKMLGSRVIEDIKKFHFSMVFLSMAHPGSLVGHTRLQDTLSCRAWACFYLLVIHLRGLNGLVFELQLK